jgi:hypothetical protein
MDFSDVYCDDGSNFDCIGGVAYFGAHETSGSNSISNSKFDNIYSTMQGSVISLTGSSSMVLDVDVTNSQFYGGLATASLNYNSWQNYLAVTGTNLEDIERGGAFYFETAASTSTIDIATSSEFAYFFQTDYGSVWRIPENIFFTDTGSNYFENGGVGGGIYYCESCTIRANDCVYTDHAALDGAMMYLLDEFDVVIDNSYLGHSKSFVDSSDTRGEGGGVYVGPASPSGTATLNISNCPVPTLGEHIGVGTISHIEAQGEGGFLKSVHDDFYLYFDECIWNNLKTYKTGGIVAGYVKNFEALGDIACSLNNITAVGGSSFFDSQQEGVDFSLSGCTLGCSTEYNSGVVESELTDSVVSTTGTRLFKFKGGEIQFEDMEVYNCTVVHEGGVIMMEGGKFTDINSHYEDNAAENGGIFHCDGCELILQGSTFEGN